ncbi:hypothetical protein [Oerskovia enterophila]|uniref:Uncharacterized protein n=1 Tax=Oerskovia enterophila TaxID=43678 RepID=A0ABX2Y329_9CELL|nr:hypothetical protein [Oerskovia enterophila]OCI30955.1 hypothetical protein OERS_23000 [Oerskovia enterophila]
MPWDPNKCVNGFPVPFTNADATNLVHAADFAASVFVNTSTARDTRYAYTFVQFGGMTLCVVGHIHITHTGAVVAGNSFIPGWMNWAMQTPAAQVAAIGALPEQLGEFPGANRYPH